MLTALSDSNALTHNGHLKKIISLTSKIKVNLFSEVLIDFTVVIAISKKANCAL